MHKLNFTGIKQHLMQCVRFCRQAQKQMTLATIYFQALKLEIAISREKIHFTQQSWSESFIKFWKFQAAPETFKIQHFEELEPRI